MSTPIFVIRSATGEPAAGEPSLIGSTTSNYGWLYDDSGTGAGKDVTLWRPQPTDPSWMIIGDYAQGNHSPAVGLSVLVKAINDDPSNPLLKLPHDYSEVWNDHGSWGDHDGSIWYPIPPDGYVSIGFVGQNGYDKPSIPNYRCVRKDWAVAAQSGNLIWNDEGSGADKDVSIYQIIDVQSAFVAQGNYDPYTGPCNKLAIS